MVAWEPNPNLKFWEENACRKNVHNRRYRGVGRMLSDVSIVA
jgi:hypothetical protein